METVQKTIVENKYRYVKNVTVNFEWIVLVEVFECQETGDYIHRMGEGWLDVSDIIEVKAAIFEPQVAEQLSVLDAIEKRVRSDADRKLNDSLSPLKDRRAALLSLPNLQKPKDDLPF